MKIVKLLIILTLLCHSKAGSQVNTFFVCPSDEIYFESKLQDSVYRNIIHKYEEGYRGSKENVNIVRGSDSLYTLPTVVHIIHSGQAIGTTQNPSNATIQQIVEEANQRFRHMHAGAKEYLNPLYGVDTKIQFSISKIYPFENETNGIKRYNIPSLAIGSYNQLRDGLNNLTWDKSKYVNLFVVVDLTNAAGVYMTVQDFTIFDSEILWSGLLCHELGHYLTLAHIFYPETGTCLNNNCLTDGDKVCDTPPKPEAGYGSGECGDPGNSCTTDDDDLNSRNPYRPSQNGGFGDQPDMLENYMDYTGPCWDSFTEGQKDRMRYNIEQLRMSLVEHGLKVCFTGCEEYASHNLNLVNAYTVPSSASDVIEDIAFDISGNRYAIGSFSGSADFNPDENVTFQLTASGTDVYVTKHNPEGEFMGAIKLGGTNTDNGIAAASDQYGNLYVTGNFRGTADFDPGTNTYNLISNGNSDVFVCKFTPTGELVWAKSIGGSGDDIIYSLDVNSAGLIAVTGAFVQIVDFDPGSGISALNGGNASDVFVASYGTNGDFLWAARAGDEEDYEEWGSSTVIDESGNVVVTGNFSGEMDFDPGPSSILLSSGSATNLDIFVCKFNNSGNLLWADRIGGIGSSNSDDYGNSVSIHDNGTISVIGSFQGTVDFNPHPLNTHYETASGGYDVFVCKLSADGAFELVAPLGGEFDEAGWFSANDAEGNVYVSGWFNGVGDYDPGEEEKILMPLEFRENFYLVKIDTAGGFKWAEQLQAQYLECRAIEVGPDGTLYVAGQFAAAVNASDFDPGFGTYSLVSLGGYDGFVIKLCQIDLPEIVLDGQQKLCHGQSAILTSSDAYSYLWNTGEVTQSISVSEPGCYRVTITNESGCSVPSKVIKILSVYDPLNAEIVPSGSTTLCEGESVTLSTNPGSFQSYAWSNGAVTPTIIVDSSSEYIVTVTDINGCVATAMPIMVDVNPNPPIPLIEALGSTTFCEGGSVILQVSNAQSELQYVWNDGSNAQSITVMDDGLYYVEALNEFDCNIQSETIQIVVNPLPDTTVSLANTILTAQQADANYQWLRCSPFEKLQGQTDRVFEPDFTGDFAVEIEKYGCIDTSNCHFVEIVTSVDENQRFEDVKVFPNPTTGIIYVESSSCLNPLVSVYNSLGQQVNCSIGQQGDYRTVDLRDNPSGAYFIGVSCRNDRLFFRMIKS